MYFSLNFRLEI